MASTQSVTTVTGYTAQHMQAIVDKNVIGGHVSNGRLILTTTDGTQIDAGPVMGPQGPKGIDGAAFIVCTSTTRPTGLTTADEGKAIYETDTNIWRIWTGSYWKPQERIVCTSTTRPTGLSANQEGTKIYETDTNLEYTWNGSRWVIQSYVICTSTTRPTGLTTGDEGVRIHEMDTNQDYWWAGAMWRYPLRVVCSSTTRPQLDGNDNGIEIYETDTDRTYVWDGASFVRTDAPTILNEVIRTSDSPVIGNSEVEFTSGYPTTFTAVAGRSYYVKFGYRLASYPNGTDVMLSIWNGNVGGTKLHHAEERCFGTAKWIQIEVPIILTPGQKTIRFSGRCLTAGNSFIVSGDPAWPGIYQVIERK